MNEIGQLILNALSVLLVTNLMFSRAVGVTMSVNITRGFRYVFAFGLLVTGTAVVGSVPAFFLSMWLRQLPFAGAVEPLLFTVIVAALYLAAHALLKLLLPSLYAKYSGDVALAMLNTVVLFALVLPFRERMDFLGTVQFAFEAGLAFLVASLIVLEAQKRLTIVKTPVAFRGLPIMLLYIGVIAMAFYGFVGHQLPY